MLAEGLSRVATIGGWEAVSVGARGWDEDEDGVMPAPELLTTDVLDTANWAYQTSRFVALGHDFALRTDDVELGRYADQVFATFAVSGRPRAYYSLFDRGPGAARPHVLYVGREQVAISTAKWLVVDRLFWHVNRTAIGSVHDALLVHAAAAGVDGRAVLLPARMESGKTTLVAGLVQRGLGYLTDEAAVIDPVTRRVSPFPKALTVDEGSWSVLPDLRPERSADVEPYVSRQWHVDPRAIRPDALAGDSEIICIVSPQYVAGATTALLPMAKSAALVLLCECTFYLDRHGRAGFDALSELVRRTPTYRLVIGDLESACREVMTLFDEITEGVPA
jgi:hypothetical protein